MLYNIAQSLNFHKLRLCYIHKVYYLCGNQIHINAKIMFLPDTANEQVLFPIDIGEIIPEGSPVRLVSNIIDRIDISDIMALYSGSKEGRKGFNPRMMLKVVIYGYMCNIFSLRGLSEALTRDAHLIWLAGFQTPHYSTISKFKTACSPYIKDIFAQIVASLAQMGEIELSEDLYIDGSTIRSRAARLKIKWRSSAERYSEIADEKIQEGVRALLEQIEEGEEADIARSHNNYTVDEARKIADAVAKKLNGKKSGSGKITEVRNACDAKEKHDRTIEDCNGRCGVSPTDPDCGIMHAKEDGYDGKASPNYNVQIATQGQYVTNFGVYDNPSDKDSALDFIDTCIEENGIKPKAVVEDAGYGCEEVYQGLAERGIEAVVKFPNFDAMLSRRAVKEGEYDKYGWRLSPEEDTVICPNGKRLRVLRAESQTSRSGFVSEVSHMTCDHCEGCPFLSKCQLQKNKNKEISRRFGNMRQEKTAYQRLTKPENLEKLRRRSLEPEPVFGQIKYNRGYQRFRHFGKTKVKMDLGFVLISHNLCKLCNKQRKTA